MSISAQILSCAARILARGRAELTEAKYDNRIVSFCTASLTSEL